MAKMGTGRLKRRQKPAPNESQRVAPPAVNLVVNPSVTQPVSTLGFTPSAVGTTIMREGFITETGFLIGSPGI